jgi:hypothetical protein
MSASALGRIAFWLLACASALALLSGPTCPDGGGITVQENFVVAYVTAQDQINVRSAPVNATTSWLDGAFPGNIPAGRGVGLAIDSAGVMHLALTDTSAAVRMVWGLGPATWDNTALSTPAAPPDSSPVGVHLGQNRWAIAFRRSGGTVFIGVYDHSTRQFLADVAPFGTLNTQVDGRPSLAVSGNTIIAAWRRWNGALFDLVTARGSVQQGNLSFSPPQIISTAAGSGLQNGVDSDPVVARAGATFFLAVVREQEGGGAGTLHGWRTQLFSSTDGQAWSSVGITGVLSVRDPTYLGLGGASNGTLLAVALPRLSTGGTEVSVARFVNGQWQQVPSTDITAMFNRPPVWRPFVIVGSKP